MNDRETGRLYMTGREARKNMKPFTGIPTDYSQKKNWLALPDKPDKTIELVYV